MKETNIHTEDQIQLPGLRQVIRSLFQLFFRFCDLLWSALIKGKFLVIAGLVVGIAAGFGYFSTKTQSYQATMLVKVNTLTPKTYAGIVEQLNQLAFSGSAPALAAELKIPLPVAGNIMAIGTTNIYNEPIVDSTSQVRQQVFKIIVSQFRNIHSDSVLQNALLTFLNTRPYVKLVRETEKRIQTEKLDFLNKELAKPDVDKAGFNQLLAFSKIASPNAVSPVGFYIQYLMQEKEAVQRILMNDTDAVSLLDGFKTIIVPTHISWVRPVFLLGAVGLLFGFIIAFLVEARKKLMPTT